MSLIFLARDRTFDIAEKFEMNELVEFVLLGETLVDAMLVLPYSAGQIARYANVKQRVWPLAMYTHPPLAIIG